MSTWSFGSAIDCLLLACDCVRVAFVCRLLNNDLREAFPFLTNTKGVAGNVRRGGNGAERP